MTSKFFRKRFQPKQPKKTYFVKSGVNTQPGKKLNGFTKMMLIHAKRQPPNLKRLLTHSSVTNKTAGVFKCSDNRCLK